MHFEIAVRQPAYHFDGSQGTVVCQARVGVQPTHNRVSRYQVPKNAPVQLTVTNAFQVPAHVESRCKLLDESVNRNGRADVFDDVALRPNGKLPRELEQLKHDDRDTF